MVLNQERKDNVHLADITNIEPMCACTEDDCKICMRARERIGEWLEKGLNELKENYEPRCY